MGNRHHERRYSGWDEENAPAGMVRQYDTVDMRWVELSLEEVPDRVIERNRGTSSDDGKQGTTVQTTANVTDRAEITDVALELEAEGTKFAVEQFEVTVESRVSEELTIDRATLQFDDEEPDVNVPISATTLESGSAATIELLRSWIYPDQDEVRIELRSGERSVASIELSVEKPR
ncbi:hypothetical protein [Natronobacterium texcoconense]|uniref:Uncharacterized protein n=1 Tax=Natronobacterium texcoconense TaxID=1095778 RepID=A0A1H1EXG2_NATTX|nr:hypothetical protein [Natronobacterium texcoconense]SDQ92836.1 hypothetical protein SAMN04489842_1719 [Natronobacterium texcoconense]